MGDLRTIIPLLALVLAFGLAGAGIGIGVGTAAAGTYDDCIAMVGSDPDQADIEAERWVQAGAASWLLSIKE